ncbi:hypothetical protein A3K34_04425 [candidate division WWE3 bacterium RIFOXYC1_FULL_40_10]|uniref:Uncharacterized protein n=1 Tax=candidate division WWE3 bacterium RIFOXYA2_FULL_46_9 TaxID=1802636 RepID=A0A1F4W225_UNCKA|nr:MAG: hypothetical protein A3K58_04425 [candidate division WWE3 bacterium RIFOXYB1_FULL_40_22]OGC62088.1 MAG: hypothetical protein A3K37_04425 [candidate division WWE3 bacterium RIFOXYA1_FULL_40_11]OGC63103.1 MAG: hypothetical protein A2264_00170 [candidate division WWE3 bacterium RIFOXYA2_FULL_46_9]OGC64969.1 MAG: hypothetical protein A2326_02940 [candidate division WWE3 bacterium RIFOXYB2_FULL_41_6]OGC66471.1 MAG: hypothetical protein A3K34_04425 [candidate division WWE3 bacterium RIFOXYC1_
MKRVFKQNSREKGARAKQTPKKDLQHNLIPTKGGFQLRDVLGGILNNSLLVWRPSLILILIFLSVIPVTQRVVLYVFTGNPKPLIWFIGWFNCPYISSFPGSWNIWLVLLVLAFGIGFLAYGLLWSVSRKAQDGDLSADAITAFYAGYIILFLFSFTDFLNIIH